MLYVISRVLYWCVAINGPDSTLVSLPIPRALDTMPAVDSVGVFVEARGSSRISVMSSVASSVLPSATLALQDVLMYERRLVAFMHEHTERYPFDSIDTLVRRRAGVWIIRLRREIGESMSGRQLAPLAALAASAGDDSLAVRTLNRRLAELPTSSADRMVTLASAVAILTTRTTDTARLRWTVDVAERYASQLEALPRSGYDRKSDSAELVQQLVGARLSLVSASASLGHPDRVMQSVTKFLAALQRLPSRRRLDLIRWEFPYREVATVLAKGAGRGARLDTLNSRLVQSVMPAANEWPVGGSTPSRAVVRNGLRQQVEESFAAFQLIGHAAPPIAAHAWLNTGDSLYDVTPRSRSLRDGRMHVIVFGSPESPLLPVLDRIQRTAPDVQVLFVTETQGHVGPDVLAPSDEVATLSSLYRRRQRFSFVIAVWAGEKKASSYGWHQVVPSPVPETYPLSALRGGCLIVDGDGVVRSYHSLDTRADEMNVLREVTIHYPLGGSQGS